MKNCVLALCFLVLGFMPGRAQDKLQEPSSQTATKPTGADSPSAPAKIDPAKEADIRRLLDLTGVRALAIQSMESMEKSIKPLLSNSFPPGEYREKLIDLFFEKFHSKARIEQLIDMAIPVYDKYLTDDEIKGLIRFYETPLGQKALSVMPQLVNEMQQSGKKWGSELGEQSMREVLAEHPDLAQALENAAKKSHE